MRLIFFFISLSFICLPAFCQTKENVIILTDIGGDTDDEQSMVRLLLHANDLNIRGLCATSRLNHGHDTKPELIMEQLKAYQQVLPNLKLHDKNYPSADYLLQLVKRGLDNPEKFGEGLDSEASEWIINVADTIKGALWISIWGGQRELAQALWKLKNVHSKEDQDRIISKLRVFAIGDQDNHRDWIFDNFKSLFYIASGFASSGSYKVREISAYRGMYMTGDTSMQDSTWINQHVKKNHGPLGALYQTHGHGTNGMKEGDSPSFLGLVANGLNAPDHPGWGGWGGRYRKLRDNLYIDIPDFWNNDFNERYSVARWRPYFQHDFQARMDWCVQPFNKANHAPVVYINGKQQKEFLEINAEKGNSIVLDASKSKDPDGNKLGYKWWIYKEPSKFMDSLELTGEKESRCTLKIPDSASGKDLHLILEVSDNGTPALTAFQRVIIKVK